MKRVGTVFICGSESKPEEKISYTRKYFKKENKK